MYFEDSEDKFDCDRESSSSSESEGSDNDDIVLNPKCSSHTAGLKDIPFTGYLENRPIDF